MEICHEFGDSSDLEISRPEKDEYKLDEVQEVIKEEAENLDHHYSTGSDEDCTESNSVYTSMTSEDSIELPPGSRKRKSGHVEVKTNKGVMKNSEDFDDFFNDVLGNTTLGNPFGGLQIDGEEAFEEFVEGRTDHIIDKIASKAPLEFQEKAKKQAEAFKPMMRPFRAKHYDSETKTWAFKGFKTTLHSFQAFILGYMRKRETPLKGQISGGFLMAPPGTGKTVMSLALTALCSPRGSKTLIVVPAAIKHQWASEIEEHLEPQSFEGVCVTFKRPWILKDKKSNPLGKYRIVLTTYEEVLRQGKTNPTTSILFNFNWHRLIFDEGQYIKNHKSKKFLACHKIKADKRWILSGTLIINDVWSEMYSYLTLLRVEDKDMMSFRKFRIIYMNGPDANAKQAGAREYMVQIRSEEKFLGFPLFHIPSSKMVLSPIPQLPFEEFLDEILQHRYNEIKQELNRIKEDDPKTFDSTIELDSQSFSCKEPNQTEPTEQQCKNPGTSNSVLTRIITKRQCADHWILAQTNLKTVLTQEDVELLLKHAHERDGTKCFISNNQYIIKQRGWLNNAPQTRPDEYADLDKLEEMAVEHFKQPISNDDCSISTGGTHGKIFNYATFLEDLVETEAHEKLLLCIFCNNEDPKHVLSCLDKSHVCHQSCFESRLYSGGDYPDCPICHTKQSCLPARLSNGKGVLSANFQGKKKMKTPTSWVYMKSKNNDLIASSKTLAFKAQILNWLEKDPEGKIIVFSEFAQFLPVLRRVCEIEDWSCLVFDGSSSVDDRNTILKVFREGECQILLATITCGGTGLNLTCASSVLILDSWYHVNRAIQAVCRILRHGQKRNTNITILYTMESVERGMQNTQIKKKRYVDETMPSQSTADKLENLGNYNFQEDWDILGIPEVELEDEDKHD